MITKTTTDQVRVTMTDTATGCVNADTGWLEVVPLPEIDFYPGNPANGCEGDTMEFGTATNFTTYIWDSPGWTSISDTTSFSVMENGTYYLTVTNSIGCQASDTLEVIFHPPPVPNVTQSYTNSWKTKLTSDAGYQSYLWSTGDDDPEIRTWKSGVFSLTVTDEYGCVGEVSLFVISIPQGVDELDENVFTAYPNPATNVLNIEFASTPSGNARLELMDASGKLVFKETPNKPLSIIDISKLPRGSYILKYQNDVGIAVKQIVLQ